MPQWDDYQEEIASYFTSLGLSAETNVTLQGVRTSHDIDVLVRSSHFGFDLTWIIECKHWKRRVSKLHVLALREIVADLGADRGVLMAEAGYQRGALEAARLTNVQLTSLDELKQSSANAFGMAQLKVIQDRLDECSDRYWSMDKRTRISMGLRVEWFESGYSGFRVMKAVYTSLNAAYRGEFPVIYHEVWGAILDSVNERTILDPEPSSLVHTPSELAALLDRVLSDLEGRLDKAETLLQEDPGLPDGD